MKFKKLTLIAFLSFFIGGCSNVSKASPRDSATTPQTEVTTIGNFIIPSLSGWEKELDIDPDGLGITLEYTHQFVEGGNVYFDFGYSSDYGYPPAKHREKPLTASEIKKREHTTLESLRGADIKNAGINIKVLDSRPTTFYDVPAYLDSIHINYSNDPKIIDTNDVKDLTFSDKRGIYVMSVSIDDAANSPQSQQMADQVWQKMLKEIQPIEVRKNAVKLAITKVVNQPKNITVTFKATNLTKQPLRLSNYSLSSSLRYLHLTSQSGKSIFLNGVKTQIPPTQEFGHIIPAGATQVFEIKASPGAYFVSQKTHKKLNADAIQKLKGEWKYQLQGDLHFADNAITHVYREPFLISGDAIVQ